MSKIVLFYEKDDSTIIATTVQGRAFTFVEHLMTNFDHSQIREVIDEGSKNNGYHYNSVTNDYEFWTVDKKSNFHVDFHNFSDFKKDYDAFFKVDELKRLVEVK